MSAEEFKGGDFKMNSGRSHSEFVIRYGFSAIFVLIPALLARHPLLDTVYLVGSLPFS